MRRWAFLAAAVTLLLTSCASRPGTPRARGLSLPVDVATSQMEALPLLLGVHFGPFRLSPVRVSVPRALADLRSGRVTAAVMPPFALIQATAPLTVVERLASADDDVLLWHGEATRFRWEDLRSAVVYATPGSAPALRAALRPYLQSLRTPPTILPGGVGAFAGSPESFLVAPEAEAIRLVAHRRAQVAQTLAVETGPWPAAVLVVANPVRQRWPRLVQAVVQEIWQNAVDLDQMAPPEAARRLLPSFPSLTTGELQRAIVALRRAGVLPDDPRVNPPGGSRLAVVFPQIDWARFLKAVDDRLAETALKKVF